ncbi:MAG: hypothetical protein M1610_01355 [Nitrospirae bacterium]|nr:hypothetical protein [Nitrospirota bacterium]MDA8339324.1 hypothetical protein [Nitrospiraceae bacterium]
MTTTLNDRFQVLYELDRGSVVILSNQEHSTKILNKPAKAVDAWYPIREDYL